MDTRVVTCKCTCQRTARQCTWSSEPRRLPRPWAQLLPWGPRTAGVSIFRWTLHSSLVLFRFERIRYLRCFGTKGLFAHHHASRRTSNLHPTKNKYPNLLTIVHHSFWCHQILLFNDRPCHSTCHCYHSYTPWNVFFPTYFLFLIIKQMGDDQ